MNITTWPFAGLYGSSGIEHTDRARLPWTAGSHLAAQVTTDSPGEPIHARTIAAYEADEEVVYERVTAVLKQGIQQTLDEMRSRN